MIALEILENNKLIAEFMGWKPVVAEGYGNINLYEGVGSQLRDVAGMDYHTSWNSLMPVVEHIETLQDENGFISVSICQTSCIIDSNGNYINDLAYGEGTKKIDVVYDAVVKFIKYWNENAPTEKS